MAKSTRKWKGAGDAQNGPEKYTTTERNALTANAGAIALNNIVAGLQIYNSTTNKMNFWNGTAWEVITSV